MLKYCCYLLVIIFIGSPHSSYAWGRQGHQIVAQIAAHFLNDSTKARVQKHLGNVSFEDAATWMDEVKSNEYYDYMRTWHYVNMEKGETFKQASQRNAVTVLHAAIAELRNRENLNRNKIKTDLFLIFHLVGDLHQPMHVGYGSDRGGNSVPVSYIYKSYTTNLHSVWDTEIIESEKITTDTCLQLYASLSEDELTKIKRKSELLWMKESRVLLDSAYSYKNDFLDQIYIMNNKTVVEKQLLVAGLRLAAVLEDLFKS